MKKTIKGFIIGVLTVTLLFGTAYAAGTTQVIETVLNGINIVVNGKEAAKVGDSFTLSNGNQVPFSISYKGTTYLPMRKVAELVNMDVKYENGTASISDKPEAAFINPIAVSYEVLFDDKGVPAVDIIARNVGNKDIKQFYISFYCYDKNGKPVINSNTQSNCFNGSCDEKIKSGETIEDIEWVLEGYEGLDGIGIEIFEVDFTDGTKWYSYQN